MRVLFLMIAYPDIARNTNMYTDLTTEFEKNGHEVYVAAPDINPTRIYNEGNIKVLRIKTLPLFNTSVIRKGLANILLPYQYKWAIKRYFENNCFDLVVTPTPPITFISTVAFLKKKYGSRIYLILRDIFPQNAKDLGIIKNDIIFNYFRNKEKKLYHIADAIGCMSPKNIEFVHNHNPEVDLSKLHLLPNWSRVLELHRTPSEIKLKLGLTDKFVAIFAGNFGLPQKIEFLIEVAEKISNINEIVFLLVGKGTETEKIKRIVLNKKIKNVMFLDHLPRKEYLELLEECDVGLVNLSDKFTIPNIPSRTLSYWSLKLPVLAAIDKNTDFGDLLDNCNGGLWSITGDTDTYIINLLFLYNNPEKRKQLGVNGYNYLKSELNSEVAYKTILSVIK